MRSTAKRASCGFPATRAAAHNARSTAPTRRSRTATYRKRRPRTAARWARRTRGRTASRACPQRLRIELRLRRGKRRAAADAQERLALASEVRNLSGPFTKLKFDFAYTDYRHKEVDNGETATTFRNRGYEARIEATHRKIGPFEGAFGVQFGQNTFSALGDELLVPSTRTNSVALFGLEEWQVVPALKLSLGGRFEHVKVDPDPAGVENSRGAAARIQRGQPVGRRTVLADARVVGGGQRRVHRTRADLLRAVFERPARRDRPVPDRQPERVEGKGRIDRPVAALCERAEPWQRRRVLQPLLELPDRVQHGPRGERRRRLVAPGADGALNEAIYRGVRAEFYGIELDGKWRAFAARPHGRPGADRRLHASRNVDTGQPLPRIAPLRATLAADYGYGRSARVRRSRMRGRSIACPTTISRRTATRRSA